MHRLHGRQPLDEIPEEHLTGGALTGNALLHGALASKATALLVLICLQALVSVFASRTRWTSTADCRCKDIDTSHGCPCTDSRTQCTHMQTLQNTDANQHATASIYWGQFGQANNHQDPGRSTIVVAAVISHGCAAGRCLSRNAGKQPAAAGTDSNCQLARTVEDCPTAPSPSIDNDDRQLSHSRDHRHPTVQQIETQRFEVVEAFHS